MGQNNSTNNSSTNANLNQGPLSNGKRMQKSMKPNNVFLQQQVNQNYDYKESYNDNSLELLQKGAVNHPLKDWASKEDMLKSNLTKIKDQSGNDIEIDLNTCLEHSIKLGCNKVKALNSK
jgi:uncharacterized protein YegL